MNKPTDKFSYRSVNDDSNMKSSSKDHVEDGNLIKKPREDPNPYKLALGGNHHSCPNFKLLPFFYSPGPRTNKNHQSVIPKNDYVYMENFNECSHYELMAEIVYIFLEASLSLGAIGRR